MVKFLEFAIEKSDIDNSKQSMQMISKEECLERIAALKEWANCPVIDDRRMSPPYPYFKLK